MRKVNPLLVTPARLAGPTVNRKIACLGLRLAGSMLLVVVLSPGKLFAQHVSSTNAPPVTIRPAPRSSSWPCTDGHNTQRLYRDGKKRERACRSSGVRMWVGPPPRSVQQSGNQRLDHGGGLVGCLHLVHDVLVWKFTVGTEIERMSPISLSFRRRSISGPRFRAGSADHRVAARISAS